LNKGISEAQFKLDILNGLEEVKGAKITEAKVILNDTKTIPTVIIDGRTHVSSRRASRSFILAQVLNNLGPGHCMRINEED